MANDNRQQGDVWLFQTNDGGEICIVDGVADMRGSLETTVYLALLGGNKDDRGDENNEFQWWGNLTETDPNRKQISRFQYLYDSIPLTSSNLLRIEDAINADLAFLTDLKIVTDIGLVLSVEGRNKLIIQLNLEYRGELKNIEFYANWQRDIEANQLGNNCLQDIVANSEFSILVVDGTSSPAQEPLENVSVSLKLTENGLPIAATLTDESGQAKFSIDPGDYWIEVSKPGFIAYTQPRTIFSFTSIIILGMVPEFTANEVLRWNVTWGQAYDLDSHTAGPIQGGGRFHVYYASNNYPDECFLTNDDTSAFGPETTTIERFNPGTYNVAVQDFTHRNLLGTNFLANSGAVVNVFHTNGSHYYFPVPNLIGNTWDVFDIDGSTGDVIPVNTMRDEPNPANVVS